MALDAPHFDKATLVTFPLTDRSVVAGKVQHLPATAEEFIEKGHNLIRDARSRAQFYKKMNDRIKIEFQRIADKGAEISIIDAAIEDINEQLLMQAQILDSLYITSGVARFDKRNTFHRSLKLQHDGIIAAFTFEHTAILERYYLLLALRAEADLSMGTMVTSADQLDALLSLN